MEEGAIVTGFISCAVFVTLAIEATSRTCVLISFLEDVIKFNECEMLETKAVWVISFFTGCVLIYDTLNTEVTKGGPV